MKVVELMGQFVQVLGLVVTLLYLYQGIYTVVGFLFQGRRERARAVELHRYAALISARNEEGVIGELVESLKKQNYPAELLDVYVVADNCTDQTAEAAQAAGATVYRRFNRVEVGKGYALDYLLKKLKEDGLEGRYEGYFVFDADNIVDPNFVSEMNKVYDKGGYAAVTGYRNSKNFGQNWISAGYSIWFLREARFVNGARQALGLTCHVSGTGYLISADYLREKGGWPYHLLCEDLQFSADCAAEGRKVGYCDRAVFYDEQPTSFRQSWDQRLRWSKGFFQVDCKYAPALLKRMARGGRQGFGCYDLLMILSPGILMVALGGLFSAVLLTACFLAPEYALRQVLTIAGTFVGDMVLNFYLGMMAYGCLVVFSEWRRIKARPWQKLIYLGVFPIFMATYIPISVAALFQKVEWKPIRHKSVAQIDSVG